MAWRTDFESTQNTIQLIFLFKSTMVSKAILIATNSAVKTLRFLPRLYDLDIFKCGIVKPEPTSFRSETEPSVYIFK